MGRVKICYHARQRIEERFNNRFYNFSGNSKQIKRIISKIDNKESINCYVSKRNWNKKSIRVIHILEFAGKLIKVCFDHNTETIITFMKLNSFDWSIVPKDLEIKYGSRNRS